MQPGQDRPGEILQPEPGRTVPVQAGRYDPSVAARRAVGATAVSPPVGVPAELGGMLLPTEHVTFATSPHWIVLVHPVVRIVVIAIALGVALAWTTHPVVRGHHVTVPLLTGVARTAAIVLGLLLVLREAVALVMRLFHFLAYRIVTTNRRVFVVEGLFGRRVKPLGNTALAGATMSQGVLGRLLGFGNVFSSFGTIRDVRDPVRLYRELEAVAMGVDGDTWQQPIRQTLIP